MDKTVMALVFIVPVTFSQFMPKFSDGTTVKVGGVDFSEYESSAKMTDWDGDGLNDLLVGYWEKVGGNYGWNTTDGRMKILFNEGTNETPLFNSATQAQAGGSDLFVSSG